MFALAETFSQQSELINLNGVYKNEFETIKLLHELPAEKQKSFNALTETLLNDLHQPQDKEACKKRSRSLREEGNRIYKAKSTKDAEKTAERLLSACRLYTQAILAAENAYEELCLAYANRGLALQDFGYYQQAYDDYACALDFGYPEQRAHRLILRQANCAKQLRHKEQLEAHLKSLTGLELEESQKEQVEQLERELEELKLSVDEQQQEKSTLEQPRSYKICKETGSRGRHLVALTDIANGELIFQEQSECFVPVEQRLICQRCAAALLCAPIPCPQCRQRVVYCSRRCRQLDAQIHYYECAAQRRDLLKMLGVSHLALRLLITHLPQLLPHLSGSSARELWRSLMSLAAQQLTETSPQILQSLAMISHLDKVPRDELVYHALCANLLQVYLQKCTKFYELFKASISTESWSLFIASWLLRNAGQLLVNGHVGVALLPCNLLSTEFALLQPNLWQSPFHLRLGSLHRFSSSVLITAINLPHLSLCNHSCSSSIRTQFDGSLVRNFAALDIKSGEEIFNCYTPDCRQAMFVQRQAQLEDTYKFKCGCKKCIIKDNNLDYLSFHRYRCEYADCRRIFLPKALEHQDNLNWWMESDEDIEIVCTFCGKSQISAWYDEFMELLERCGDEKIRSQLYKAFEGLDTWLLDYHALKLTLAKELIVACFAAKETADWTELDFSQLIRIIEFQLVGISSQTGHNSTEYFSKLTYLLDIFAWRGQQCHAPRLLEIRNSFELLPKETREIFVNYYNDFIEQ